MIHSTTHPANKNVSRIPLRDLTVALAFLLAMATPRLGVSQTPQASTAYPTRWEYRVVPLGAINGTNLPYNAGRDGSDFTTPFQDGLAKFGVDGWELVSIDILQGNKVAIFKRPVAVAAR